MSRVFVAGPEEMVVLADASWHQNPMAKRFIDRASRTVRESGAAGAVFLDTQGLELPGLRLLRGGRESARPMSEWIPIVLEEDEYSPEAHRSEAEQYRDRIGDRLLRPEAVDPDKKHLIGDDLQRAARVLELGYEGRVLDVGTSDGTLLLKTIRHWDLRDAVGVDVAASAISEANAAVARDRFLQGRVTFVESFIEDLGFPDGTFDTVAACETLEHIGSGQFQRALANLLRMLRRGGRMLVTVPNRYPAPSFERDGRARWAWPAHHQFFTQLSLRYLLAPHFERIEFFSLYDGEAPADSIYLICRALGRR